MHCIRPLNFGFEKRFGLGILLGMKLVGKFVEILIFSEQSDRSRCLPKS